MHSDLSLMVAQFPFFKHPLLVRCVAAIQKWVVRHADIVIAVTAELKETVEKIAPGKPVHLIRNVAVDEAMPPASKQDVVRLRQQLQLGSATVLLYTGTLEFYQGIDLLLQSAALVHKEIPSAHYVLVGGHPHQVSMYRQLAQELGITEIVHFTGQRPPEEMPQYMALADILLSPRREGTNTPLKLYTYLRSGKPIIATETYSHTELLSSDTSLLVAPTPEGLAQGALELLRDAEKAHALGTNGKKLADEQLSWPVFLQKNAQAYDAFTGRVKPGNLRQPKQLSSITELTTDAVESEPFVHATQGD
jgi:glycosyltransferase involved in cell wall biosynthesis